MKLAEWISARKRTQADVAAQLDVTQPYIALLLKGRRVPSVALLKRISAMTEGQVGLADFGSDY